MRKPRRHLTLEKGAERFIFRWEKGQETGLLRALLEHVEDERTSFDAFDAAVLGARLMRMPVAGRGALTIARGRTP